jgi:hypothetical protein
MLLTRGLVTVAAAVAAVGLTIKPIPLDSYSAIFQHYHFIKTCLHRFIIFGSPD